MNSMMKEHTPQTAQPIALDEYLPCGYQWLIQLDNSTSIGRQLQYSSLLLMRRWGINQCLKCFCPLSFLRQKLRVQTILDVVAWATGCNCRKWGLRNKYKLGLRIITKRSSFNISHFPPDEILLHWLPNSACNRMMCSSSTLDHWPFFPSGFKLLL
jgi:hypothetical protein